MTRSDKIWKYSAYGVALVIIAVVNYALFTRIPMTLPLLLPMAAVAAGVLEGPRFGAGMGIAAGILFAAVGHESAAVIPLLALGGWVCGVLAERVLRRDLVGHVLCAAGIMVLGEITRVVWLAARGLSSVGLLLKVAGLELLWTMIFSLPVYWLFRFCCVRYGRIYHA